MDNFEDLIPDFEAPDIEAPDFGVEVPEFTMPDVPDFGGQVNSLQEGISQQVDGVADLVASIPAAIAGQQGPEDEERGGGGGGLPIGQLAVGGTAVAAAAWAAYQRLG